ncbi:MAG: membrane protein insertase YidC, partial [bacterium]|nr:membrane protein insertase YidC [bacterium]
MENRRLFIAALLSAVVLIVWNLLFAPERPVPEEPLGEEAGAVESTGRTPAADSPVEVSEAAAPPDAVAPDAEEPQGEPEPSPPLIDFGDDLVAAEFETSAVIETEEVRLEFSNRGAQLHSFLLKDLTEEGETLDVVRRRGADFYPFALMIDGEIPHPLNDALFEWEQESDELGNTVLRFRHRSELGTAEKVFRWTSRGLLGVEITVPGESGWGLLLGPGVRNPSKEGENRFSRRIASYRRGEETDTFDPNKVEEDIFLPAAGLRWVGLEDNHFLTAAVPIQGLQEALIRPVAERTEVGEGRLRFLPIEEAVAEEAVAGEDLRRELLLLLQASGERLEVMTFLGAKRYSRLQTLPYGLEETVRWGEWLRYLAL